MSRHGFVGLIAVALAVGSPALAQTGRVSGTVRTAEGARPLSGVQVRAVGTTAGAITREDGTYQFTVQPGTYTVRATRIGYAPDSTTGVVVTADAVATADFQLTASVTQLAAIVSVGYGTQEERDATGAVEAVTSEEFNTGRVVSPQELIRAKVPGVQVVDNNEPGGGISLRIRGGTSVNASNEPLYVVDGVPLQVGGGTSAGRNPLNFLNPNDIESVSVLKDASATAIYGSRGANGVVIITTRSGRTGPQFTYNGSYSTSQPVGGPSLVTADQFRAAVRQFAPANDSVLGNANTDWLELIQRDAGGMEHNIGFAGQRQDLAYRLGLGYLDQDGVLRGTRTQRLSASINSDDRFFGEKLNLRLHLKGSRAKDAFTPNGVLGSAVAFAPTQPTHTAAGSFYEFGVNLAPNNPLAELALVQDEGTTLRSVGNLEAEYAFPFLEGLSAVVRAGYDVVRADRTTFSPSTLKSQIENGSNPGNITRNSPEQLSTVLDAYGRYERELGWLSSTLDVTAGYSAERFRGDYPSFFAQGLSTNLLGVNGVPSANETRPFYNVDESRLLSGFARANWNVMDRYLFTATVRRDGSSRFAEDNQYGTFPSVAVAWRALEEPFLQGLRGAGVSDLKVRLSWGKNGNQAVGNYLAFTTYTIGQSTAQAQLGSTFVPTVRPSASDPDLRWEQTSSTNLGFDYGFWDDRITGSLDLYTKKTTDLIFTVPTAAGTALSNFITTNIGSVRNRGLELSIGTGIFTSEDPRAFGWDVDFNASANRNELLSVDRPGVQRIRTGGIAGGVGTTIQVLQPGVPVNSFLVYRHKIVDGRPLFSDVNNSGAIDEQDLYEDLNADGVVNQSDLRPFHDPAPRWILGHTSNMRWRGFDGSFTVRAYLGSYVYNNVASNLGNYSVLTLTRGPTNLHASALETGFTSPQYLSDIYVQEASFVRMDNLTVGYTFDRLVSMERPRVFVTGQNLFTSTDYEGVDPTAGVNGIDNNIYPRSRTFVFGLSLGF